MRGNFRLPCDRGYADVYFTLAPTMPPKVQYLRFAAARELEKRVKGTAETVASLVGVLRKKELSKIPASAKDAETLRGQLEALRADYGTCRLGATLSGDGRTDARVRFARERGQLDVSLRLRDDGKLLGALFSRPPDVPCIP